jgi:hypothetical protein
MKPKMTVGMDALPFAETVEHGSDRAALGCVAPIGEMELDIDRRMSCLYFDKLDIACVLHQMRRQQRATNAGKHRG